MCRRYHSAASTGPRPISHELGERAAKRGLRVGYEALAWGKHIFDHRDAWEIVRRADHPNIGLILDSFHTLSRKIDINSIRSIPIGRKIFIVQLADAPLIDMDLLYWSRHFRNMPGEGDLAGHRLYQRDCRDRIWRLFLARNLQRPVPGWLCKGNCRRWLPLAHYARRPRAAQSECIGAHRRRDARARAGKDRRFRGILR